MSQNDTETQKFIIGGTILGMMVLALLVAGIFMAMAAVASFVFLQWRGIYRYEGGKPVLWLLVITAIIAVPCLIAAYEQFELGRFYLQRKNDRWVGLMLISGAYVLGLAVPTALYWIYRKIKPVSHFRINIIETFHRQYQAHEITKSDRDSTIKAVIEMGDVALEKMVADRQKPASPAQHSASAFDVPEQD